MSNAIRFDPVLVRALAAELNALLAGRPAHPFPVFDSDLSATLGLDRGEALRFDLHPSRGWVRVVSVKVRECESAKVTEPTARIVRVHAPADERLLRVDLREGNRFRGGARSLVVELHTNQWNAVFVDADDRRIVSVLRAREAGARLLRTGEVYLPPEPHHRLHPEPGRRDELRAEWINRLAPLPPGERRTEMLRAFAGTSPVNAAALLGSAAVVADSAAVEAAFTRWWEMTTRTETAPSLLETTRGRQPYPFPLDGVVSTRLESLLAAFDVLATAAEEEGETTGQAELLAGARRKAEGARRRAAALNAQLETVGEADRLRLRGDLLLAHLHLVPVGAAAVTLPGFEGGEVEVPLDPALRPHENAARWYDEARRLSRAEERLPDLILRAEAERRRWEEAVAAIERGEAPAWVAPALARRQPPPRKRAPVPERLPFRLYRTSGGLEVRVGRGARDNDALTFRHAAHEDVWLHARHVPGSHVILRWTEAGAPPARDLEEAAVLAALHSKARSSGTVAVDWTRRKHVRKPRGAPPGRVTIQHAKTLLVAPDPAVEERLRVGE
ncbi:MAG TPA: NFACT RNA binding domain-containing protein [Longimicrobium sp.]|nr:NFACT RNA binding domain-containing protein [Longimicrobium sp.]